MSLLKIDCALTDDLLFIQLEGRLDGNSAPELGRTLGEKLPEGCTKVVFDLSRLTFIISAGLREFMVLTQKLDHRNKAKAVLVGVQPTVGEVLEISGMSALFKTAPTVDEGRRLAEGQDAKGGFFGKLFSSSKA